MADIYLASRSPRRRELLHQIGVRFETLLLRAEPRRPADVDESQHPSESAEAYVERVALEKAVCGQRVLIARSQVFHPVLAADTVVVVDGQILGKPENGAQAAQFLHQLSGRTHEVRTSVALAAAPGPNVTPMLATSVSRVTLRTISDEEIQRYCDSNEPLDKAGGYAIQGRAAIFVAKLEGSYSGVVGLPLAETALLLMRAGIRIL
ncbi:MAG TPA: Maf family protein [Burkholderiaceae bacterium]|jgi:septum formation protein|nr:Maf family protein [Burkholderiaceae bacterium]